VTGREAPCAACAAPHLCQPLDQADREVLKLLLGLALEDHKVPGLGQVVRRRPVGCLKQLLHLRVRAPGG